MRRSAFSTWNQPGAIRYSTGDSLNRRQFIFKAAMASFGLGAIAAGRVRTAEAAECYLDDIKVIDIHAHPHELFRRCSKNRVDTPTVDLLSRSGIVASGFAAVGDYTIICGNKLGPPYDHTMVQMARVQSWVRQGYIDPILKGRDLDRRPVYGGTFGAILTVEGGDPLGQDLKRVERFYDLGVRVITLMHYTVNELGDTGREAPKNNGLTCFGRRVVERMNELGMVIDVTHSDPKTLRDTAEVSAAPLIDSHTHILPSGLRTQRPKRLRTWWDVEAVARTGGVVCTWPLARCYSNKNNRWTFEDWALEILEIKKRMGIAHVGLGTDGGGGLPARIRGYRNIMDLPKLASAMLKVGLTWEDVRAYMGGNVERVLKTCLG